MDTIRAPIARASCQLVLLFSLGSQALGACSDAGDKRSASAGTGGVVLGDPGQGGASGSATAMMGSGAGGESGATDGMRNDGGEAGAGGASVNGPGLGDAGSASAGHGLLDAGAGGEAGACSGLHGCPEPVVVGPSSKAFGVALDHDYVYWTTLETAGNVLRAPLDGGAVETIASNEPRPFDIAVGSGTVFWCTRDAVGHVVKAPAAGGTSEPLATGVGNGVARVTSDGVNVYYLTNYNVLMSVPIAGGTPVPLSAGPDRSNIVDLALSAGQLYWANSGIWNTAYTLKEPGTAGIAKVSSTGTPSASSLVTQLDYPEFEIAVDDAHVFWSDQNAIYRTGLLGGTFDAIVSLSDAPVSAVLPSIDISPIADLVSDGSDLYFADAHNVYRVPVSGGIPKVVSWGWTGIQRLAVDGAAVYFTDGVAGVVKLAK